VNLGHTFHIRNGLRVRDARRRARRLRTLAVVEEVDVMRRVLSCTLFAGLGTAMAVAVLLAVLPSVRIAGGADATDGPTAVRAVLIEGPPGAAQLAAPEAWRRCPYLAAVAARSGCPFLAARAAGPRCPYLDGLRRGVRCPAWPPRSGMVVPRGSLPPALRPALGRQRERAVSARLAPAGPRSPVVASAHPA